MVWEYSIPDARFFGIDPINDTHLLFTVAEDVPADECDEEFLTYKQVYGKFEAKTSFFRVGMKLTDSVQPPPMLLIRFSR